MAEELVVREMIFSRNFFRATAAAAFITGLTTLCVHLMPRLYAGPADFDRLVGLHAEPYYILRLWIVLGHVLLVAFSMLGLAAKRLNGSPGLMIFGFLGYLLFTLAELLRTSMGLFAINRGWRAAYAQATDESVKLSLRTLLEGWPGVNDGFFFLLVLGFFIGNLCFGLSFIHGAGPERYLGIALLLWSLLGLNTILGDFAGLRLVSVPEWISWTFQPAVRFFIAWFLWREASTEFIGHKYANGAVVG